MRKVRKAEPSRWQSGGASAHSPSYSTQWLRKLASEGMGEIHAHTLAAEKLFRTQEENFEVDPHVVGIEDVTRGLGLEPGDAERIQRLVQDTNPEFKAKSQTQRLFHARGRLLDTMKHSMKHVPSDLREQVLKRALQFWKKTYQTDYGKDATLRWGGAGNTMKSTRFVIPLDLLKSSKGDQKSDHKYLSRKANGKGGYDYVYKHPAGHEVHIAVRTKRTPWSGSTYESIAHDGNHASSIASAKVLTGHPTLTHEDHTEEHERSFHDAAVRDAHESGDSDVRVTSAVSSKVKGVSVGITEDGKVIAFRSSGNGGYDNKGNVSGPRVDITDLAMGDEAFYTAFLTLTNHGRPDAIKNLVAAEPAVLSALKKFASESGVAAAKKALTIPASLFKAEKGAEKAGHLYTKRTPDGKGGWHYDYGRSLARHDEKVKHKGQRTDVHSAYHTERGKVVLKTHPEFTAKQHEAAAADHRHAANRAAAHHASVRDAAEKRQYGRTLAPGEKWKEKLGSEEEQAEMRAAGEAHQKHRYAAQGHEQAAKTVKGREKRSAAAQRKYDKSREPIEARAKAAKDVADAKHNQALRDKREGKVIKLPGLAQPKDDAAAAKVEHVTIAQRGMHDGGGYRIKIGSEHEEALKDHPSWKMIKDKTFHDHGSAMDAAQRVFRHTKTVG